MASSSTQPSQPGPGYIIDGRYKIIKRIDWGAFGQVFLIKNMTTNEQFAVKMENVEASQPRLQHESMVYKDVQGGVGIPRTYFFGTGKGYNSLVMDHLGPSLSDLFDACDRRFRLKTVLMLAHQILARLEHIHTNNFIHRDIKPKNFLMGLGDQSNILFLIDFGMAKRFRDPTTLQHIPFRADKGFTGTSGYASVNAHLGYEQSRRDDLEAIGFLLVYFLKGSLPWKGLTAATTKEKNEKVKEMKQATTFEVLCKGLPSEFTAYFNYCRNLRFEEEPDYRYLSSMFRRLFTTMTYEYDNNYDWNKHMKKSAQPVVGPSHPPPISPKFNNPVVRYIPPKKDRVSPRKYVQAPPLPPRKPVAVAPPPPPRNTVPHPMSQPPPLPPRTLPHPVGQSPPPPPRKVAPPLPPPRRK